MLMNSASTLAVSGGRGLDGGAGGAALLAMAAARKEGLGFIFLRDFGVISSRGDRRYQWAASAAASVAEAAVGRWRRKRRVRALGRRKIGMAGVFAMVVSPAGRSN